MVMIHQIAMSAEAPPVSRKVVLWVAAALAVLLAALAGYGIAGGFAPKLGPRVAAEAIQAWQSGDRAAVDAAYAPSARVVLDGRTLAAGRAGITSAIKSSLGLGDTYAQVGTVAQYSIRGGDIYVSGLVEVDGPQHPGGEFLTTLYQIRDGQVIHQVFTPAPPG